MTNRAGIPPPKHSPKNNSNNNTNTTTSNMSFTLSKKGGDAFASHPETDRLTKACIVDITSLKKVQTIRGEKEQFRLVFESEVIDETAQPPRNFVLWSRGYTPSLHEKANFAKDIKAMLGRPLTRAEEDSFLNDSAALEKMLLGLPVLIMVKHAPNDKDPESPYANISDLRPDKSDTPFKPSGKFVREIDRPKKDAAAAGDSASYRKAGGGDAADNGRQDWQRTKVHLGPSKGLDLGDLDEAAVRDLLSKFLPKHAERVAGTLTDRKATADDTRLAAALVEAQKLMEETAPY